jgi:hypothetical protein
MSLPKEGNYQAELTGQIVIYETTQGAMCAAIPLRLTSGDTWSGKSTQTLVKQDGTVQEKTAANLKSIFGDPTDTSSGIYRFSEDPERPIAEIEAAKSLAFEVVIEHRQDTDENGNSYAFASVKWINPLGGGVKMPEAVSKKDFMAKHGAKFRALGFGAGAAKKSEPAKPAEAAPVEKKPTPAPAKKATPPAAPAKTAASQPPTATMEEAWERLCELKADLSQEQLSELWLTTIAFMFPGKESGDLSIQNWGALKARFESDSAPK